MAINLIPDTEIAVKCQVVFSLTFEAGDKAAVAYPKAITARVGTTRS